MYLNKLILRNFKKYRRAELEFQEGLTGIVGGNGAGKSTIVEAIAWALYGNKASAIKRDLLKNTRASDSDNVEVKLFLNIGKQELTIYRSMRGKSLIPEAVLFLDNLMIASGSREVDLKLEEMLNISYQDFMKTFYARQKDLDNLLKEGGPGKREYLLKLLGIEDIKERSIEQIKFDRSQLEEHKNRVEGALIEIGDVDIRMEATCRSISAASSDLKKSEERMAVLAEVLDKCKKDLEVHLEKKRSNEFLAERASKLDLSVSEKKVASKENDDRLAEIQVFKNLLADLVPKLERLENIKSRLNLLEPLQKKHEELYRKMAGSRAELDGIKRLLKEREDSRLVLQKEREVLEEIRPKELEFHQLLERLEKFELLRDRHSELLIQLKGERTKLNSVEMGISRTEADIKELLKAKSRKEEIEPLKIEFSRLKDELAFSSTQKEKKKVLDDLVDRKINLEARRNRLLESASISRLEISAIGDLAATQSELMKLEIDLDLLGTDLNNCLTELKGECSVCRSSKNEASRNLARVKSLGADGSCPTCERPLGEQHELLIGKYELAIKDAELGAAGLKIKIKSQMEKIDGVSCARSNLKKSFDELNVKKSKLSGLDASLRGTEIQITEVNAELKEVTGRIDDLGEVQFDLVHFKEISAGIEELQPIIDEYAILAVKLEELPKKQQEMADLETERQRLTQSSDNLSIEIKAINYDDSEHILTRKRSAELKPVHDRFTSISQKMDEIPTLDERITALKEELGKLQGILECLNKAIDDLGFNPSEYDGLLNERRSLSKMEEEANKIRLRLAAEPEIRRRMEETLTALADLETELKRTKDQIVALGYSQELHRVANDTLSKAEDGHGAARKEASEKEVSLRVLNGELMRVKAEAVRKKDHESDLAVISRRLQVVDTTRNIINRFLDQVLIRVKNDIARSAGEILEEVSGKYSLLKIDDDFNIQVEDGGNYYPISRYSGGEIDMIAVSVRVAISEYLMRFGPDGESYSFLILDEVFGSQDLEHREKMINMLRSLEERFPQIIAISHISDVQGQFDNTIQVVEDEMGNSRVEVV